MTLFHPSETYLIDSYRTRGETVEVEINLNGAEHTVVYDGPDAADLLLNDARILTEAAANLNMLRNDKKEEKK